MNFTIASDLAKDEQMLANSSGENGELKMDCIKIHFTKFLQSIWKAEKCSI